MISYILYNLNIAAFTTISNMTWYMVKKLFSIQ